MPSVPEPQRPEQCPLPEPRTPGSAAAAAEAAAGGAGSGGAPTGALRLAAGWTRAAASWGWPAGWRPLQTPGKAETERNKHLVPMS